MKLRSGQLLSTGALSAHEGDISAPGDTPTLADPAIVEDLSPIDASG
jgi:hypothetical protein